VSGAALDELAVGFELRAVAERYAMAVDRGDGEMFAAQFTENGILEAPRGRYEGRPALATVPPMMTSLYDRTFHAVVGQVPVFHGEIVEAQTYTLARHYYRDSSGAEFCYEMTVRYEDRFEREDGRWLLASRVLTLIGEAVFEHDRKPRDTNSKRRPA
jgi:SnoaL-like domain